MDKTIKHGDLVTSWEERNYNDWNFGMMPTRKEIFRRKCIIYQLVRFIFLSFKFKKTAAIH